MAILNNIRKRGVFLIIIIALALFSFILADVIRNGGFSSEKSQTTVATVNGNDIDREEFMREVEATQRNLGPNGTTAQAMSRVWSNKLRSVLLEEQFEKLGLSAEKEQISNALRTNLGTNTTFMNEAGVFDEGKLQEYIASAKAAGGTTYQQWLDFEKSTEIGVLQNSYYNMIKGGLRSTIAEGEQEYRFENDKLNFQYVFIPYTKIADEDVAVSEEEIRAYVKSNPTDFKVDAKIDMQYVAFSEDPSAEDIAEAKNELGALLNERVEFSKTLPGFAQATDYKEFINEYSDRTFEDKWSFKKDLPKSIADSLYTMDVGAVYGPYQIDDTYNITKVVATKQMPDSIQSKHILIRYEGSLRSASDMKRAKEDASKLADSILSVIKRDRSKFASLAALLSEDNSNKDKGGDLGYSAPGVMVPAFDTFIIDNKPGNQGVVETDFGFHVIQVVDHKNIQKVMKLATVVKEIEASEKTLNDVFSNASKFEVASRAGDFSELAKEKELNIMPVNKIGVLDATIPGIGSNRSMVQWGFEEDSKVGDVKRFSIPNGYAIAQLTRKDPKGLLSVAEASVIVTPILRNEKKATKIRESVSGTSLQEIATSQSVAVQTATAVTMAAPTIAGAGAEPTVVGAAFGKKAGEETEFINGDAGVYKVRVLAVNNAPDLENYSTFANQINAKTAPSVNNAVYQALKNAAKIEDNRANFF